MTYEDLRVVALQTFFTGGGVRVPMHSIGVSGRKLVSAR
jgi:hypothetical protein